MSRPAAPKVNTEALPREGTLVSQPTGSDILVLNGGSSSIRFALYRPGKTLEFKWGGKLERIGTPDMALKIRRAEGAGAHAPAPGAVKGTDSSSAGASLIDWLQAQDDFAFVGSVGHRLVHGMDHSEPQRIDAALLAELRRFQTVDPDHLPGEIHLAEHMLRRHPQLDQVACFDTAFHHDMPRVARQLAIPRRFEAQGLRRYGFHGLSYAYLMEALRRIGGSVVAEGRVVLAHLGSGASLAAVRSGIGIDTSMGFTPAAGLPMGTRSGDLDPGLAAYLVRLEQMTVQQFDDMANHACGLLGISETSSDMRQLLDSEASDQRAAEAVAFFCYQVKKWIGSYAAALGGIDTLVFAGGIGEGAPVVRARICDGLDFLGIAIDAERNAANAELISIDGAPVSVLVIRTNEELMIARAVSELLGLNGHSSPAIPEGPP